MIIQKIQISNFRGFRDKEFDFGGNPVVLLAAAYGVGRTTMIDAIEWGNDKYGIAFDKEHYDMNKVSPEVFMDIVDELDAIITIMSRKGIVAPDYREITTQTNLIKRALGIAKNENVFGIDDFELNYNEMISKNTSIIRKTYSKIKKAFKEFWNPAKSVEEKERREPDYLGNQKVEIER